jgi:cation:H+ antiporter
MLLHYGMAPGHATMPHIDFASLTLPANIAVFAAAAAVVWLAGVKLTAYAKVIADRSHGGQALVGILLLGTIVSLPEFATTIAAARLGDARLAVNTLFGGIAATMAILAVTDALTGPDALSTDISHPNVLLQGVFVILFLTITATGIVVGDIAVGGVGLWTLTLLGLYVLLVLLVKRYGVSEPWIARDGGSAAATERDASTKSPDRGSLASISIRTAGAAAAIMVSGFALAGTGEALAEQTGLGSSFVGMLLGGAATSLPEVTTTVAAVRLAQYEMAFADVFGTNLFSVMLLFVADIAYSGGPILNEVDRFSLFATLLGTLLTGVYLAGLIERRHTAVLGMGIDSIVVLGAYLGGLVLLFLIR